MINHSEQLNNALLLLLLKLGVRLVPLKRDGRDLAHRLKQSGRAVPNYFNSDSRVRMDIN